MMFRFLLVALPGIFLAAIASTPLSEAFAVGPRQHARVKSSSPPHTSLMAKSSAEEMMVSLGHVVAAAALSLTLFGAPLASFADGQTKEFKLPPIDFSDKTRCSLSGSQMGQANAARDKLYDLRMCDLAGKDGSGLDLSGVIMTKTNLKGAKLVESYFSKAYLKDSYFDGADFTNAVVDRATFQGSSLRGAIFQNAVLTGTNFEGADVENADFTESYLGSFDTRTLCKNPTLKGENPVTGADTRASVGGCP